MCLVLSTQLTVNFGFVLRGSSVCTVRKSFVRMSLEKRVIPVPPPGIGKENFILESAVKRITKGND